MSSPCFFSIIIPTYNRAHLITATIKSVLAQNFTTFEIIVVDDGSTDNTEETVKKITDKRLNYFKKQNAERGAARNFGWQKASGEYITFLDSDDLLYPHHLQTAYEEIKRLNNPHCIAQAFEIKDHQTGSILLKGHQTSNQLINEEIFKGNFLACFGVFIKREVYNEIRFEEERKLAGTEDWLLWLQMAARYPLYFNNQVTGALVEHNARSVNGFNEESLLFRPEFIKTYLQNDAVFIKKFGAAGVSKVYSHLLTYTSLYMAVEKKKKKALSYLVKAFKIYPPEIINKRTLAIFKKLIFN